MSALVVPSDVTILENKHSIGVRNLSFLESIGLMCMPSIYHCRYSKIDKHDMRKVLQKQYPGRSDDPVVEILKTRQNSISKKAISHNGWLFGMTAASFFSYFSFRSYDWKTKLLVLPFAAYGGAILGRCKGNLLTGRWSEDARDRFLGMLPARGYYSPQK
eukprot:GHVR01141709.1.p1 GENE.GHVR01141709.1~~GHVR01141709.1.p1  ORF type:complete len:160 (-),score=11.68 GHVR01141709.1:183-662(-)